MDMTGTNLADDLNRDRAEVADPLRISPAIAWVLSLVVPGAGQAYCGNTTRGAWVAFFFAVSLFGVFFLIPTSEGWLQLVWWVSLRVAIVLYAFATFDAYFTAREIILGEEWPDYQNPRVAAVLNLLTMGGGYLYLGEREKGFVSFLLLSVLSRSALTSAALLFEVALIIIAVDAYRIAAGRQGEAFDPLTLAKIGLTSVDLREAPPGRPVMARQPILGLAGPVSALGRAVPVAVVCLLGAFYLRMISLSIDAPSYDMIDQSQASITQRKGEFVYNNPVYGVEARVPDYWTLTNPTKEPLFSAETMTGKCDVALILETALPFSSLESKAETLARQVLMQNNQIRFLRNRPEKLGNLPGYEVAFAATVQGDEWFQSHVLALSRGTLFRLVTTASRDRQGSCWNEAQKIRKEIMVSR